MALNPALSSCLRASCRQIIMEGQSVAAGLKRLSLSLTPHLIRGKCTDNHNENSKGNPATKETIAEVPCMDRRDTDIAMPPAYNAFNFLVLVGTDQDFTDYGFFFAVRESFVKVPLVEEIRHSPTLGGYLIKINCSSTTEDRFWVAVSYQFCAQMGDLTHLQTVSQAARVCVILALAQVKASEIVHSNICATALKHIKLVAETEGVTFNDSYGSNIEVLHIERRR